MKQATLRTVTLETVANYRQAAEHAISAYRASGHRLLQVMSRNVDRAARRGADRVAPRLAAALRHSSDKVAGVAAKGIDALSARSERVVELGSAGVGQQVGRVADLVEGIENRYLATGLQAAARLSLSGARAALSLSETLMAGAEKLSAAVQVAPAAAPKRMPARRAAKAAPKAAAKARKAVAAKTGRARRKA